KPAHDAPTEHAPSEAGAAPVEPGAAAPAAGGSPAGPDGPSTHPVRAGPTDPIVRSTLDALRAGTDRSPSKRLLYAIALGELSGRDAALSQLGDVASEALDGDVSALRTIYTHGPAAIDAPARDRLIDRWGYFGEVA